VLTSLSVAPETTAPLWSSTVPEMLPPVAAHNNDAARKKNVMARRGRLTLTETDRDFNFEKSTQPRIEWQRGERLRKNERSSPFPRGVNHKLILGRSPDLQAKLNVT
jgi:hypothetical protein